MMATSGSKSVLSVCLVVATVSATARSARVGSPAMSDPEIHIPEPMRKEARRLLSIYQVSGRNCGSCNGSCMVAKEC